MKLLYAIVLSLFPLAAPVAAPAQSADVLLLSALCSDDYHEDTAGHCRALSARELLTLEAILEKCGAIISSEADDEVLYLMSDPEDIPVGSVQPRGENRTAEIAILPEDESSAETEIEREAIASQVVKAETRLEKGDEAIDEVTITGPTARQIPAADGAVDDSPTTE